MPSTVALLPALALVLLPGLARAQVWLEDPKQPGSPPPESEFLSWESLRPPLISSLIEGELENSIELKGRVLVAHLNLLAAGEVVTLPQQAPPMPFYRRVTLRQETTKIKLEVVDPRGQITDLSVVARIRPEDLPIEELPTTGPEEGSHFSPALAFEASTGAAEEILGAQSNLWVLPAQLGVRFIGLLQKRERSKVGDRRIKWQLESRARAQFTFPVFPSGRSTLWFLPSGELTLGWVSRPMLPIPRFLPLFSSTVNSFVTSLTAGGVSPGVPVGILQARTVMGVWAGVGVQLPAFRFIRDRVQMRMELYKSLVAFSWTEFGSSALHFSPWLGWRALVTMQRSDQEKRWFWGTEFDGAWIPSSGASGIFSVGEQQLFDLKLRGWLGFRWG